MLRFACALSVIAVLAVSPTVAQQTNKPSAAQLAQQQRMTDWYAGIKADTVVVAHGGTARALMVALGFETPQSAADLPIAQGAVYVFGGDGLNKYS